MDSKMSTVALEDALDLRRLLTSGSILHINEVYEDTDHQIESGSVHRKSTDYIGGPVKSFDELEKQSMPVDPEGLVKKKIIEEGGGFPLHKDCAVSVAYSGFWENEPEPFDVSKLYKPLVVDLKDNGLLPGLQIALESMLVGEMSVFLFSYQVMYGEKGIPPRIKPKAKCVFYIKLIKSILTPKERQIDFSEPDIFQRVHHEVKLLYTSGLTLSKTNNYRAAIQLFRKGVSMLHKCRLANEEEEKLQEKLLIKLCINLAICYNKTEQPLKACTACNELNRRNSLWNNTKALFQNAKALRMIGVFNTAEKKLKRALYLSPESEEIKAEYELLKRTRDTFNRNKLFVERLAGTAKDIPGNDFKREVDTLIKNFKENVNLCKLTLPEGLNLAEIEYVKQVCIRENLFCNEIKKKYALDKNDQEVTNDEDNSYLFL